MTFADLMLRPKEMDHNFIYVCIKKKKNASFKRVGDLHLNLSYHCSLVITKFVTILF